MATFKQGINDQKNAKTTNSSEKTFLKTDEIEKRKYKPTTEEEEFRPIQISSVEEDGYVEAYFHTLQINGFSQKVYCPKHNDGQPCPVCDKKDEILARQKRDPNNPAYTEKSDANKAIYKEAMSYAARKYYIIRGVDQGSPKDGPKFFRFGESIKKDGIWDKLSPAIEKYIKVNDVEPTDLTKGCTIKMTCAEKVFGNNKYFEPTSIEMSEPSPLHSSAEKAQAWVNDSVTWKEIFRPSTLPGYPVQKYLAAALDGTLPTWDKESKKWIDHEGNPIVLNNANTTQASPEVEQANQSVDTGTKAISGKVSTKSSELDDLPF